MLRSLYSGVSGLRANQTDLDVTANNIANSNTVGYKRSGVVFQDLLSQLIRGATGNGANTAGQNPAQVGLGVRVADISMNMSQGSLQQTGKATDVSIQGDGFFVVAKNGEPLYTRAGAFGVDEVGVMNTPDGARVQGWMADAAGGINTAAPTGDIILQVGQQLQARASTTVVVGRNLDASSAPGTQVNVSTYAYDSLGGPIPLTLTFTKGVGNAWTVSAATDGNPLTVDGGNPDAPVTFDANGALTSANVNIDATSWAALGINIPTDTELDFGGVDSPGRLTGMSVASTVVALSQDGYAPGTLLSFSIGADGVVSGAFSNGRISTLAQLAVVNFANASGLEKIGSTEYRPTPNSGVPQLGVPGTGGRGLLIAGALEMSNVDLGQEFTELIVSQRGVQANSRVLSASDEVLQEVLSIKR